MTAETIMTISISVIALLLSCFSLGWNIYRDVILKARVKVTVSISYIHHGGEARGPYINITVTNLGPGDVIIQSIYMAQLSPFRFLGQSFLKLFQKQNRYAHIMWDYTNEYSSKLPQRIGVGEYLTLLLLVDENSALSVKPTHLGVTDSFGRYLWANKRSLKQAQKEYLETYAEKPWEGIKE